MNTISPLGLAFSAAVGALIVAGAVKLRAPTLALAALYGAIGTAGGIAIGATLANVVTAPR